MKKKKRILIILGSIFVLLLSFWGVCNIIPISKISGENPYLQEGKTYISAHRGGSSLNPENTEKAFDYAILETSYCDYIELDVHATKDDVIVINHDETINRTSAISKNNPIYIRDHNFSELATYNIAKDFKDREGNKPYFEYTLDQAIEENLTIMRLDDFLTKYKESREVKLLVEIKAKKNEEERIAKLLIDILNDENNIWWKEKITIISFNIEALKYVKKHCDNIKVSPLGGIGIALPILCKFGLKRLAQSDDYLIQIMDKPTYGIFSINLGTKRLIEYAHQRNQALTFWTVNEKKDMEKLVSLGADIITTDNPDILYEVITNS